MSVRLWIALLTVACLAGSGLAQSTAPTQPTTGLTLPAGALKIKINGVEGIVQARTTPGAQWQKVTVGMELAEGSELRTGPKSAVRFTIGDDHTVSLVRLG
jgi:hypothetical protein